jgi:uncharacterized repeat protein (TIGR03803 family)
MKTSTGAGILLAAATILTGHNSHAEAFPRTVHSFGGTPDGYNSLGELILSGDTLFGATESGGTYNNGTLFSINTNGTGYKVIYSFPSAFPTNAVFPPGSTNLEGTEPVGGLVICSNRLFGAAELGGPSGMGTLFSVNMDGTDYRVLHSFSWVGTYLPITNLDGAGPNGDLLLVSNTFYGTTFEGGNYADGTVFKVNADGSEFSVLHSFGYNYSADGGSPNSGLVLNSNMLYGTTRGGGMWGVGTIFAVSTDGTIFTVLHTFGTGGNGSEYPDGAYPRGGLTLSGNTLYGTTTGGGSNNGGTIFSINLDGSGFTQLYSFSATLSNGQNGNTNAIGANPWGTLVASSNFLYGTADTGTTNGNGIVFALQTDGGSFTVLHTFSALSGQPPAGTNLDGANPETGLLLSGNVLYGTTIYGGTGGYGTIFSLQDLTAAPVSTVAPGSQSVTVGKLASFSVAAYGSPPFSYQWLFNGTNVAGATNAVIVISNAFPTDAGPYAIIVTNGYGSITSAPVTLTVLPLVLTEPASLANGQFQFNFDTGSNVNYTIQYSSTLTHWISLLTIKGNGDVLTVTDPQAAGRSAGFYRVLVSK